MLTPNCRTPDHRAALRVLLTAVVVTACSGAGEGNSGTPSRDTAAVSRPAPVPVMPVDLTALEARPGAAVARITVRRDTSTFGVGPAVVTFAGGDSVVVSDSAYRAWALGGPLVAVSGLDGAGGYENEGQSLTVIDISTGTRRRVVADYFPIVRVEMLEAGGRRALLVHMRDGGQGSLHVTVVDPKRGQVFRSLHALGRIDGDRMLVAGYGDGETPVVFGDTRTPLRVDTISVSAVETKSLLVVPRAPN